MIVERGTGKGERGTNTIEGKREDGRGERREERGGREGEREQERRRCSKRAREQRGGEKALAIRANGVRHTPHAIIME